MKNSNELMANLSFDDFWFFSREPTSQFGKNFFFLFLTKFVCPWSILSLSNLNGISDEYKIQIQVSQDKQYFDCILNKRDRRRDKLSHKIQTISNYLAEALLNTNMSVDCLSVCKIIDMIYY